MNIKEIKELVKLLVETDITELNLESDGTKVVIKKGSVPGIVGQTPVITVSPAVTPTPAVSMVPSAPAVVEQPVEFGEKEEGLKPNQMMIVAPMVGTFYRSSSPDASPYVEMGQMIEAGQVVCIIEAMKLMNEIESEIKGRIVNILVENAQPVEYGQPLFILEKA